MDTQKPGWLTTEFWAPIISMVMTVLVSLHYVPAADAPTVMGYISAMVTSVVGLGGSILLILHYVRSRTQMKAMKMQLDSARWEPAASGCGEPNCVVCKSFAGGAPPQGQPVADPKP